MSDAFYKAARGRPWSEQGCIERLITIFFVLFVFACCLGAIAFIAMAITQTP